MEEVIRIELDPSDRDYMQFLNFERSTYKDILGYILLEKQKGYEYSIDNYNHFMNEYKETMMKHDLTFHTFLKHYAPEYAGNSDYFAEFDFDNCELVIKKSSK